MFKIKYLKSREENSKRNLFIRNLSSLQKEEEGTQSIRWRRGSKIKERR